jgi:hypothetical protein
VEAEEREQELKTLQAEGNATGPGTKKTFSQAAATWELWIA